jgi:hypothetical protein
MIDPQGLVPWFVARLPQDWFSGPPRVLVDRDEIMVIGRLRDHADAQNGGTCPANIDLFRESTREERMRIAADAEARFERRVSWGVECDQLRRVFTSLSVPVMTRLRLPERVVLDTLIGAGVARSRSDALAWCVRLVAANQDTWLDQLRQALSAVEDLRAGGPRLN